MYRPISRLVLFLQVFTVHVTPPMYGRAVKVLMRWHREDSAG